MARPPRIEFQGAFYHVIVRGNQKQDIFLDNQDRIEYLKRLQRYKERCKFIIHAYVLMPNHVHLLIETPKTPLSKIMQLINFTYTQYFNRRHSKVGHLFQGRYKAFLCDRDRYLLGLLRYIHLNPVRVGFVADPSHYPWSSHRSYLENRSGLIEPQGLLQLFSENVLYAKRLYKEFVEEAIGLGKQDDFYKAAHQQILGDERFVDEVIKRVDSLERPLKKPTLNTIAKAIEEATGVTVDEIFSRGRKEKVVFARCLFVSACREVGYKIVELRPKLARDPSVLSRMSKVVETDKGKSLIRKLVKIINALIHA